MFNGSENRDRRLLQAAAGRSARPISTARPNSTAPIISRRCRQRARPDAVHGKRPHGPSARRVTQSKLDNQRGVVQNEKRQGDNQPDGLVQYALLSRRCSRPAIRITTPRSARWPTSTRASLDDVKHWFRRHYGPNNAVLVLAGDIDAAEARPLVEKYFGDIPRRAASRLRRWPACRRCRAESTRVIGSRSRPRSSAYVGRAGRCRQGLRRRSTSAAGVLGGLASSRLDKRWCATRSSRSRSRRRQHRFERVGDLQVDADVQAGRRSGAGGEAARRSDRRLHREGPDRGRGPARHDRRRRPEIRASSRSAASAARRSRWRGRVVRNDPGFYKKELAEQRR